MFYISIVVVTQSNTFVKMDWILLYVNYTSINVTKKPTENGIRLNRATFIRLRIAYDCFSTTTTVTRGTVSSIKPKIFTIWPFKEVCQPCDKVVSSICLVLIQKTQLSLKGIKRSQNVHKCSIQIIWGIEMSCFPNTLWIKSPKGKNI